MDKGVGDDVGVSTASLRLKVSGYCTPPCESLPVNSVRSLFRVPSKTIAGDLISQRTASLVTVISSIGRVAP